MSDNIFDYISPEDVVEGLGEELQDTLRRLSKAQSMIAELEAEVARLQSLIAEAVRDFHGKSVLFGTAFLDAAEGKEDPNGMG